MKILLLSILLIGTIYCVESYNYSGIKEVRTSVKSKVKYSLGHYRSSELSKEELKEFLLNHSVKTVIRLNGEKGDSDGLSIADERKICRLYGVKFIYLPMTTPYDKWAKKVISQMNETTLVHCHHGYDRTGFIFAYLGMTKYGYTFNQVRKMNGWDKWDKYSKVFYPTLKGLKK